MLNIKLIRSRIQMISGKSLFTEEVIQDIIEEAERYKAEDQSIPYSGKIKETLRNCLGIIDRMKQIDSKNKIGL